MVSAGLGRAAIDGRGRGALRAPVRDRAASPTRTERPHHLCAGVAHLRRQRSERGRRRELIERLRGLGVDVPRDLPHDALLDLAFSTAVAPRLPPHALTFVYDFPASQAALARIKPQTPPVAARFEVFAAGIELANGFAELTDAAEQRRRFDAQISERVRRGLSTPPLDEDFLSALERGLPACAGVAVGLDRLIAVALGFDRLAPALSFAHFRPNA